MLPFFYINSKNKCQLRGTKQSLSCTELAAYLSLGIANAKFNFLLAVKRK
jgi:hypothetical protein